MNLQAIMQAMQNPQSVLSRLNLPKEINSPQQAIQYLMNNGRMSQQQYNQLRQMAEQVGRQINLQN